jgi:hypothetical protein
MPQIGYLDLTMKNAEERWLENTKLTIDEKQQL